MVRRGQLAVTCGAAGGIAALALLVACGSGDDTTSPVLGLDAGGQTDATTSDACVFDGGAGVRCNACTTPATDPYNACSSFTSGCIPFDAARVPTHPTL